MKDKKSESPNDSSVLTRDIQAYMRRRADNHQDKISGGRKHTDIQLLISELDNLLLNMSQSDATVYTAREKLADLKKSIVRELELKQKDL